MTELETFNNQTLDIKILNLPSQNHKRKSYVRSFLTKELLRELIIDRNLRKECNLIYLVT